MKVQVITLSSTVTTANAELSFFGNSDTKRTPDNTQQVISPSSVATITSCRTVFFSSSKQTKTNTKQHQQHLQHERIKTLTEYPPRESSCRSGGSEQKANGTKILAALTARSADKMEVAYVPREDIRRRRVVLSPVWSACGWGLKGRFDLGIARDIGEVVCVRENMRT